MPDLLDYVTLTGEPPIPIEPPRSIMQGSRICRQGDLCTDAFRYWISRMGTKLAMHRKLWEWYFIPDALFQRNQLIPGKCGVGFGVGGEPLPAVFASFGCHILASDQTVERAKTERWIMSNQHASSLANLRRPRIISNDEFDRLVSFKPIDMNDLPLDELRGQFDFCWSSCAFEHIGSIENGLNFVLRSTELLRPGGIAVHTTEYNISSNSETFETDGLSLFRRRDIERLSENLAILGHTLEPVDFNAGNGYVDGHIDLAPFDGRPKVAVLKLRIASYDCTSIGLIIRARQ